MNGKKEEFYTFKPRVHRHNDPREYSKQLPRRFPREVGELCIDGFDEKIELEIDKKENNYFKPRVHRHNDPSEYSKQSPRRFPREVGELCINGFDEEEIEENEESVEEINPKQKTLKKY